MRMASIRSMERRLQVNSIIKGSMISIEPLFNSLNLGNIVDRIMFVLRAGL